MEIRSVALRSVGRLGCPWAQYCDINNSFLRRLRACQFLNPCRPIKLRLVVAADRLTFFHDRPFHFGRNVNTMDFGCVLPIKLLWSIALSYRQTVEHLYLYT